MKAGRVIGFRAWDPDRSKMMFPMVLNWWQDEGTPAFMSEFVDCDEPHECTSKYLYEVELMQFTGLRDKNGKEIYEGDIVRLNDCGDIFDHVVRWIEEEACFVFDAGDWYGPGDMDFKRCEVIGNIYEKPESLLAT
ncbi:YopX family protein [Brevibacillus centrosporus]|uniref:YopX family protein n=1 Tax=Brevibacillus centrosporus TaxID=54910 RepID=UPI0039874B44